MREHGCGHFILMDSIALTGKLHVLIQIRRFLTWKESIKNQSTYFISQQQSEIFPKAVTSKVLVSICQILTVKCNIFNSLKSV